MARPLSTSSRRAGALILGTALALTLTGSAALVWAADPTTVPSAPAASVAPVASAPVASASMDPACAPAPAASSTPSGSPIPAASPSPVDSSVPELSPTPAPSGTPEPDTGAGNAHGDVPDNAVFLTYHDAAHGFSIQYVEGWQVTPQPDGVVVRDKDSSETVAVVAAQADIPGYVASTDLPALQAQPGFRLVKQNTVKVGGNRYVHLVFHQESPPDSVTGKQVPQTVDRYYVPGTVGFAIVSLATPDGVDNVDAFRQMIESFKWS
jgi:hypothetical protein